MSNQEATLVLRAQNQVTNARLEDVYSALAFLYDLRGDSLATSDEYTVFLHDGNHAREFLYRIAVEPTTAQLLYGYFSGRNVEWLSPSELEDRQWEERQAAIQAREPLLAHEIDSIR